MQKMSLCPNQSLANNISWQYVAGDDKAEIGLYWYKRFFNHRNGPLIKMDCQIMIVFHMYIGCISLKMV